MAGAGAGARPGSVRSRMGKAAALARLLNRDCTRLLELYREREGFSPDLSLEKGRIVALVLLFERVIGWEIEQGFGGEGEYERVRSTVKDRLGHLLQSTKNLLAETEGITPLTPDPNNPEETDGLEKGGIFEAKLWTFRVLQELIHWTQSAAQTLHSVQSEREKERGRTTVRKGKRDKGEVQS
ncbi:hypothetical protein ANANG_G00096620 [Anguilla anguilla]|uniref:Ciliary neurotrophic factor n=1 Tax=Anguilla anguilla TaxID=7936 RepID=A0A9D3RYU5_ANGAN|nr:hypothetical protein ANANG_G00096620 [Anguilla anguilla]